MVKRLQSVKSGGYADEVISGRGTPLSSRRSTSGLKLAYPNAIEAKTRKFSAKVSRNAPIFNKKYVANILSLNKIPPTKAASAKTFIDYSKD